jgi:ATP-dependent DNA helicase Rep
MKACNVLDFDDLILLPTLLLQRNEEVRELAEQDPLPAGG